MKKLFVLYALLIVHFSLYPWRFEPLPSPHRLLQAWEPVLGRSSYLDVLLNFLFYVPFGTLAVLAWPPPAPSARKPYWRGVAIAAGGAVLALGLETLQAWVPTRDSSVRDVVMNAAGAVAGIGLGCLLVRLWPVSPGPRASVTLRPVPLIFVTAWLIGQCFPFLPILRLRSFHDSLQQLMGPSSFLETAESFVAFLVVAYLLRTSLPESVWPHCLFAAFLVLPLRLFLRAGSVPWPSVLAAAAALFLSPRVLSRVPAEPKLLASLAVLLIAAKEFSPFSFTPTPAPFYITPFAGFLGASRDAAIRVTSSKFFLYGSSLWLLRRAGLPLWASTLAVELVLVSGELAQRYLPGRVPESTDPVMALLAALLIAVIHDRPREKPIVNYP